MDALSPIKLAQNAALQVSSIVLPDREEDKLVDDDKPSKPKAKQPHVDVVSGFFGVVTPLASPSEDPESYLHQMQGIRRQSDEYNWRVKDGYLVSDGMLRVFRDLINSGNVHWHWLSSWWMYSANFDEVCGFNSALTDSHDMITSDKDKMRYIKKLIKRAARHDKRKHNIIWLDPGFGPERDSWQRIAAMARDAHIQVLKVTPRGGLRRKEVTNADNFVRMSMTKKPRDKSGKVIKPRYGVKFYESPTRRTTTFDGRRLPNEIRLDGETPVDGAIKA